MTVVYLSVHLFLVRFSSTYSSEVGGEGENCTWTCTHYPTLGSEEVGLDWGGFPLLYIRELAYQSGPGREFV
jgi:hypothetical protein